MSEVWTKWEGHVVGEVFPLLRYLGGSDHSGVFLTSRAGHEDSPHAALKLVPAIPTLTEAQLSQWHAAAGLAHPHLLRLYETGRCQLGDSQFLFAVMEYAEQNLAQLLLHRALTGDETREMLLPTLDAVAFLHGLKQVQGQLKPSNFLVVGEELRLASDTIRPAGESTASLSMTSVYDPPEARDGSFSTAGDIWALGVTIVEALTRSPPAWGDERRVGVELPADLPPAYRDAVRRCLSPDPADRPSVSDLLAWINRGQEAPAVPLPQTAASVPEPISVPTALHRQIATRNPISLAPVRREPVRPEPIREEPADRKSVFPSIVGVAAVAVAAWAAFHLFSGRPSTTRPVAGASQSAAAAPEAAQATRDTPPRIPPDAVVPPPPAPPRRVAPQPNPPHAANPAPQSKFAPPPDPAPAVNAAPAAISAPRASSAAPQSSQPTNAKAPAAGTGSSSPVVHEEIPSVSLSARDTITGHVRVAVRVTVDSSGAVVNTMLEDPGPSPYFARLASQAAKKWKFAPANAQASRRWVLRFAFARDGTTAHATAAR